MSINVQLDSVSADMERVFRPIAGRIAGPGVARESVTAVTRRGRSRWLMLGAPILVLIAGTALGVNYVREEWRPQMASAKPAAPVRERSTRTSVAGPEVVVRAIGPAVPATLTGDGDASAAQAPEPPERRGSREANSESSSPRGMRDDRDASRMSSEDGRGAADDRPIRSATVRRGGDAGTTLPGCVPGSLEDRCIYQDVLNADGRLRRAFERAKQDGVGNRDLTVISRRWRQARELASDDPDGTIRRYDRLADALDDLRRDTGE